MAGSRGHLPVTTTSESVMAAVAGNSLVPRLMSSAITAEVVQREWLCPMTRLYHIRSMEALGLAELAPKGAGCVVSQYAFQGQVTQANLEVIFMESLYTMQVFRRELSEFELAL